MNLYKVMDANYDWCCFVFETTRNRAKLRVAESLGQEYIDMRCKTLKKGVNVPRPMTVDDETAEGYDMVVQCGYGYSYEEEPTTDPPEWLDDSKAEVDPVKDLAELIDRAENEGSRI